jgi:pimeloyl-ACP methyl ester carboxylesterase
MNFQSLSMRRMNSAQQLGASRKGRRPVIKHVLICATVLTGLASAGCDGAASDKSQKPVQSDEDQKPVHEVDAGARELADSGVDAEKPEPDPASSSPIMECAMAGIGATVITADAPVTIVEVSSDTARTVPYCLVKVKVDPAVNIWVAMPTDGQWNGRLMSEGGGGFAGSIDVPLESAANGFVGVRTDTGHMGFVLDGAFGMLSPGVANTQLQIDFAYRSEHLMAVVGKQLIRAFYGQAQSRSYWAGCSTGGRQGLMMAQRYPEDYDGIVAGAPAIHFDRFEAYQLWPQVVMNQDLGAPVSGAKQELATHAAVRACDDADGVTDGVIDDPPRCSYEAVNDAAITKSSCTSHDNTCLTVAEARVIDKIWSGARDASGRLLWPGIERGAATSLLAGSGPFPIGVDMAKYWVYLDPSWDWKTLDYANYEAFFDKAVETVGPMLGTDDPDLSAFKARGGKLISYHGWADPAIPPQGTVQYFEALQLELGGAEQVSSFAKLFMVPGMDHCGGGAGANQFGQLGSGGVPFDADHNVYQAMVKWVEQGVAPEKLIATKFADDDPSSPVLRTRLLCEYPMLGKYKGSGSTDDAANFGCAQP